MIQKLLSEFQNFFGHEGQFGVYFAPGRVNLIGEHTDYNGGHAFPCSLDFGTYGVVRRRRDKKCRLFSLNIKNSPLKEFRVDQLEKQEGEGWSAYEKGVAKIFSDRGYRLDKGFDMLMYGTIPNGAGLSSSASVELLTAVILNDLGGFELPMIEMVKMAQMAENTYVGMQCGILDQFAIGMGKAKSAILLDCNTLDYTYAPLDLKDVDIIIGNTNKKRGLVDSKYNERRKSCEEAVKLLNKKGVKISYLGELSAEQFEDVKGYIKDPEKLKRARHAVYENLRTVTAVDLLQKGDLGGFGKLMNESHVSLRDDYEVSCPELDVMTEAAWNCPGTIGARMTGGGFGGCTVNLVKHAAAQEFIRTVGETYREKTPLRPEFYVASIGDGAKKIGDYHEDL
ncbi:MAG: galactokinase [Fusobacteriaceae bacterium]|jgi:galactokinase|nr:galactokinase [Fusobacteriaceae bacterium]